MVDLRQSQLQLNGGENVSVEGGCMSARSAGAGLRTVQGHVSVQREGLLARYAVACRRTM